MSNHITYNTRRIYDGEQVLEIDVLTFATDEFGITEGEATFVDKSRHIAGTVSFMAFGTGPDAIGKAVMGQYDLGNYIAL